MMYFGFSLFWRMQNLSDLRKSEFWSRNLNAAGIFKRGASRRNNARGFARTCRLAEFVFFDVGNVTLDGGLDTGDFVNYNVTIADQGAADVLCQLSRCFVNTLLGQPLVSYLRFGSRAFTFFQHLDVFLDQMREIFIVILILFRFEILI